MKKVLKKDFEDIKKFSCLTHDIINSLIGIKVEKYSKNPFKSTFLKATVKGIIEHPILKNESAFIFEEDDSYVAVIQCKKSIPSFKSLITNETYQGVFSTYFNEFDDVTQFFVGDKIVLEIANDLTDEEIEEYIKEYFVEI